MGTRLGRYGRLRLSCQRHRSQAANRREVIERFANLLREALKPRRRRIETKVPVAARQRRLEQKRLRGRVKRERRKPSTREE